MTRHKGPCAEPEDDDIKDAGSANDGVPPGDDVPLAEILTWMLRCYVMGHLGGRCFGLGVSKTSS